MTKNLILSIISVLLAVNLAAQGRNCGTVEYTRQLEAEHPGFAAARQQIEAFTDAWVDSVRLVGSTKNVITIPVVVHVLYHPSIIIQNIPHYRVLEQLDVLNTDYAALNADTSTIPAMFKGDLADTEIRFCLAMRDPDGNWTDGVTRTETSQTSFDINDNTIIKSTSLGGHDPWDRNKYLNIWVCNLGGNILGYAQPPGGPSSTDGVVISYKYFGVTGTSYPYNKGRTSVHEVGHFFNLMHIWGDDNGACWGTDYCDDTPNQASDNYGCPNYPHASCNNTSDMFMNYMDYVDDACMVMFSNDQRDRMLATLSGFRLLLQSSDGCEAPDGIDEGPVLFGMNIFPVPAYNTVTVSYSLSEYAGSTISIFNATGSLLERKEVGNSLYVEQQMDLGSLPGGLYIIRIDTPGSTMSRVFSHISG